MANVIQIVGAVLVLAAYLSAQVRLLDQSSPVYLVLNVAGSAVLAYLALDQRDWGFLLLEGSWALMSAWGLLSRVRRRTPRAPAPAHSAH